MQNNFAGWNLSFFDQLIGISFIFGIPIVLIMLLIFALRGRKEDLTIDPTEKKYDRIKDPMFWFMAIPAGLILLSAIILFVYSLF